MFVSCCEAVGNNNSNKNNVRLVLISVREIVGDITMSVCTRIGGKIAALIFYAPMRFFFTCEIFWKSKTQKKSNKKKTGQNCTKPRDSGGRWSQKLAGPVPVLADIGNLATSALVYSAVSWAVGVKKAPWISWYFRKSVVDYDNLLSSQTTK